MKDTIFLYIVAVVAFGIGLTNLILFLMRRSHTAQTVGTIISIQTLNPQNTKYRNSKWAFFSYTVKGKTFQSQNPIQVPMASQVGTALPVCYDIHHPEKLYSFSGPRIVVSFLISLICMVLTMFDRI